MSVSIVIPAFNSARYLAETIASVRSQTYPEWELLIVDDGSTDQTIPLVQAWAAQDTRLRLVQQAHQGMAAARNRGLAEADPTREYLIFLDHDDLWHTDTLQTLVEALAAAPSAVAAAGLSRCIDDRSQPWKLGELEARGRHRLGVSWERLVVWPVDQPTTLAVLAYTNCIATMGLALIRRSALATAGLFDPATVPCDDWDMWLRLSQRGDILFVNRVVIDWRSHTRNTSSRRELIARQQRYVRRKLLTAAGLSQEQRQTVRVANRIWGRKIYSTWGHLALYSLARGQLRQAAEQFGRAVGGYAQWRLGKPLA